DGKARPPPQFVLAATRVAFCVAEPHRRVGVTAGPRHELVEALDADRRLLVENAQHVGHLGQEPGSNLHPTPRHATRAAAPSAAQPGSVVAQVTAMSPTIFQDT